MVADGKIALIGGINIANRCHGTSNTKPWLDFAIEINSSIAKDIQSYCKANYSKKKSALRKTILPTFEAEEKVMIQILQNDWLNRKSEISKAYIKSIHNANEKIIIVGSYFLPGRKITKALLKAAKHKVKVQLILSGVSDLPMTRRASCYLYSKLLKHNIELYEWDQSILHGKVAVIDGNWTTIGSFNLNNLSSYGSLEMKVEINSSLFSKMFQAHLIKIIAQCQSITLQSLKTKNNLFTKSINFLSYCVTRIIEIIVTYTPYKRFNN